LLDGALHRKFDLRLGRRSVKFQGLFLGRLETGADFENIVEFRRPGLLF